MVTRRWLGPLALALGSLVFACQILGGIERVDKEDPGGGGDAGTDSAPPSDPCVHAKPPDRPVVDDAPLDQLPPFIIAVRTLDLVPRDSQGAIRGFDLDGVCTCDTRPFTFGDGGQACRTKDASSTATCDNEGGVDNQGGLLFKSKDDLLDINKGAGINDQIATGRQTLLIYLSGYNGLANDREVNVGLFLSQGLDTKPPTACDAGTPSTLANGKWSPTFCGDDPWSIVKTSVTLQTKPLVPVRTGPGWVTNHKLVASIGGGDVPVPFGQLIVQISSTSIIGDLVALGADLTPRGDRAPASDLEKRLFRIDDGFVTGRLAANQLLAVVGTFPDPGKVAPHLCGNPLVYAAVKDEVCSRLDIPRSPDRDLNPNIDCDAISFAFGFTGFPALDGPFVDQVDLANECQPGPSGVPDAMPDVSYSCP